jgi:hypothetical protein
MNPGLILRRVQKNVIKNSPSLLTAVAITGVVSTAYLAARASWRAALIVEEEEAVHGKNPNRKERYKQNAKLVWKEYIPAAATGTVTIASIVGSTKVNNKRGAAAQAALVLSERAYSEYRERVIEQFGERKDRLIRDEIAEKKVQANPPSATIISGPGNVLCCELYTKRYFTSDIEDLRRTTNRLNEALLKQDRMSLDDWYEMVGLESTSHSSELGWKSDRLMELEITYVSAPDGRPCLAFEYNYITPIYGGFHE